jgi:hypothetical protein
LLYPPLSADRDFVTAWAALPDDILARAVGLSTDEISVIRKSSLTRCLMALNALVQASSKEQQV